MIPQDTSQSTVQKSFFDLTKKFQVILMNSDPDFAVEIANLNKTYDVKNGEPKRALKDINLSIPRGSFFGLLGPNGAGKSTLINIMAGLVIKTSGHVRVWGYDIERDMRQARSAIGVVPQELNIDPFFSPREILEVQAGLYGVPKKHRRTDEILKAVHLIDKSDAYTRALSGGMRRRLLIAKAMVHSPPVLVLDEPTAGVDVELRQQLWAQLRELREMGTTILLTTHYLEEAESLCDTIAIINNGELVTCQPTREILKSFDSKEIIITVSRPLDCLTEHLKVFDAEIQNDRDIVFRIKSSDSSIERVISAVAESGLGISDITTQESDLEDIFLLLTRDEPN